MPVLSGVYHYYYQVEVKKLLMSVDEDNTNNLDLQQFARLAENVPELAQLAKDLFSAPAADKPEQHQQEQRQQQPQQQQPQQPQQPADVDLASVFTQDSRTRYDDTR